jgi:hypothetical protein
MDNPKTPMPAAAIRAMTAARAMAWVLLVCAAIAGPAGAQALASGEAQRFEFRGDGAFADRPITVHYFKPRSAGPDAKVLFAIHGVERDGQRARDNWTALAEKNQVIVVAPEFDLKNYPNRSFQMGGMQEKSPEKMTFALIEQLFDRLRRDEGLTTPTYLIFGHSAGAQFVHRLALMADKPRFSVAVAANAGSYTVPAYAESAPGLGYPWVLEESVVSAEALRQAFGRKLIVLLGENDTSSSSPDFPRSREAAELGANRFERGNAFFARAGAQAGKLGQPLQWQLHTVPGVGHNSREMARAAAPLLFPE